MGDAVHIDAARGDVGGHKHADLPLAEFIQRAETLVLGAVGVDGTGGNACLLQTARDPVGTVLGPGEDENHVQLIMLQKMKKEPRLQVLGDLVD
jgi:hypothetical protein